MSKVHDVDPKLIARTQQWLAGQQQGDGSWKPDASFINEGATNRYNKDVLRITAYLAWALENTGYQGQAVEKAKQFIETHANAKADAYTLAVLANFATDYRKDREFTRQAMQLLLDARTERDIRRPRHEHRPRDLGASCCQENAARAVKVKIAKKIICKHLWTARLSQGQADLHHAPELDRTHSTMRV